MKNSFISFLGLVKAYEHDQFNTNVSYIIGSNNYEGNLLWMDTIGGVCYKPYVKNFHCIC